MQIHITRVILLHLLLSTLIVYWWFFKSIIFWCFFFLFFSIYSLLFDISSVQKLWQQKRWLIWICMSMTMTDAIRSFFIRLYYYTLKGASNVYSCVHLSKAKIRFTVFLVHVCLVILFAIQILWMNERQRHQSYNFSSLLI